MSTQETSASDWSRTKPDPELRAMVKAAIGAEKERAREREEEARIAAHPMLALIAWAEDQGWHDMAKQAEAWLRTVERDVTNSRANLRITVERTQTLWAERNRYRKALAALADEGHEDRCRAESEDPATWSDCICSVGKAKSALEAR
jgi:hypothetical protein